MGQHKTHLEINGDKFDARCSCRAVMLKPTSREEAELWIDSHLEMVDRIREHLTTRTPPLEQQRDFYREKAADPKTTTTDRLLWEQLADELDTRIGTKGNDEDKLW